MRAVRLLGSLAAVLTLAGCAGPADPLYAELPEHTVDVTADDFVLGIDNPFLPYVRGASWTFYVDLVSDDPADGFDERIEIRVLNETRVINGVTATVVQDTVYDREGNIVEDTFDWFAQDSEGNVWYLGEDTCEFEGGACASRAGSFEWGVDGALPGIVMHADPRPGEPYYQEYYEGEAVDRARNLARGETVTTPLGTFTDTLLTEEWDPRHPSVVERVVYVRGIGPVIKGEYDVDARLYEDPELLVAYDVPGSGESET